MQNPVRTTSGPKRLTPQPGEVLDRSKTIEFEFDGKSIQAHPGDTIGSALAAADVQVLSRSFKYHRPRGLMCCAGNCPNCLVQIGNESNVRACVRQVVDGMEVKSQNAWPSLDTDLMSAIKLIDSFLPAGFYYKTFLRPQFMWPLYEKILRAAAGLGKVFSAVPDEKFDKQYLHCDVAVVGGGPAGIHASLAAANQGARVLLCEESTVLGGHLRHTAVGLDVEMTKTIKAVEEHENIKIVMETTVLGCYEDHWISAMRANRLIKIRSGALVVATGAVEQPLVFGNNDLPGVMLASGVARFIHMYGVLPGSRVMIVTANEDGWQVAADLITVGVNVVGVADERPQSDSPTIVAVEKNGTPIYWEHTITAATGHGAVREAVLVALDSKGEVNKEATTLVSCDIIAVSVGWMANHGLLYQSGGKLEYNEKRAEILAVSLSEGVYAAGRVNGTQALETQIKEGNWVGAQAAAQLGFGKAPSQAAFNRITKSREAEPRRTSPRVSVPGHGKRLLCYCEDVSEKDLQVSIEEGFNTMELLKRYSTVTMGPCQGRMCSMNSIHLCARENGWSVAETGTTTARPPMRPVTLGALGGQNMEPVALTSIHDWHLEQDAAMMVAGVWMRPEYYGSFAHAIEEVRAVRERVGLIDVSTLGKMKLTGAGVPNLLDRIYINKWQKLAVGRVRYGLMCNEEGIVMDDGVTAHIAELEWYMSTTSSGATTIFEWIQWWMQSGWGQDVHLVNVTEVNSAFNLAGPQSRALIEKLTDEDVSNENFPYMHVREMDIAGVLCRLSRIGFTGELSYEIHTPAPYGLHVWKALLDAGKEFGILPFGVEAQRILRLEKAHIIVGQDTDALSDPISADMEWAVKLDKPEFLGNQPLARIKEKGSTQKLVGFKMLTPGVVPDEGLQIIEPVKKGIPEIIGWVTSSRMSPTLNQAIGLCWLPAVIAENVGSIFNIRIDNQSIAQARVHHGAFVDPDGTRLKT
ncbi:MAG: 2Fe-2S iron-sulfur cluster-binding protein [Anaerolineae bacterium]|nr:2Fe-2S iron-sulfur cluster-binding protein [Anaerolineae bacterium]